MQRPAFNEVTPTVSDLLGKREPVAHDVRPVVCDVCHYRAAVHSDDARPAALSKALSTMVRRDHLTAIAISAMSGRITASTPILKGMPLPRTAIAAPISRVITAPKAILVLPEDIASPPSPY
jgi:hypothetical protein